MTLITHPGEDGIVTGHNNGEIKERCRANEADATDEWVSLLRDFAE